MPSQKVITVLDSIRNVHQQLAARYHELDEAETDERIKLLLEDMEKRERTFDECVGEYKTDQHPVVLQTWLQFVPEEAVQIDHIGERLAQPRSLEELVEETLQLNCVLQEAYQTLANEAPIPEVADLFSDLAQIEQRNDCHYAKMLLD